MKSNLGRITLLLLLPFTLFGAFRWEVALNKKRVVQDEAILLTYRCYFTGEAYGTSIDIAFSEATEHAFRIEALSADDKIIDDNRISTFKYVLFPNRAGELHVNAKAILRTTSKEQVENAVIGRDNMEYYQFDKDEIALPQALLHVKRVDVDLVGKYTLHVTLDKQKTKPFEPVHLRIEFAGVGNIDRFKPFSLDIQGAQIFTEKPFLRYRLTQDGYKGEVLQKFAIVSEHNFTIPKLGITVYDIEKQKDIVLAYDARRIIVANPYKKEALLDTKSEDTPTDDFSIIYYLFTLLLGILIGWHLHEFVQKRSRQREQNNFKSIKDVKTMLTYLALQGGYDALIAEAEQKNLSLGEIKKRLKK